MKICKSGTAETCGTVPQEELEAINGFARRKLTEEDVYTFSVLLCDNDVDRDNERFTEQTLQELRELFVGKTGLFDHEWSADRQAARIYRTELVTDPMRKNALGEPYMCLKGHAYMLRIPENEALIAEIEGGIKRETSVGCAVARRLCSVCGEESGSAKCCHVPGEIYNGKRCCTELSGAVDAYEWSFVAVPAQKNAGVCKALGAQKPFESLKAFVSDRLGSACAAEYAALEKSAETGRRYLDALRKETLRLALVCDRDLHAALSPQAESMDEDALLRLKKSLEKRVETKFTLQTQLPGRNETFAFDGEEYRI